jgi:quinolinate synthase
MKLNTLEKIKKALEFSNPEVSVEESLRLKAKIPLQRMMDICADKPTQWPESFNV